MENYFLFITKGLHGLIDILSRRLQDLSPRWEFECEQSMSKEETVGNVFTCTKEILANP